MNSEDDTKQLEYFLRFCYTVAESVSKNAKDENDFISKCETCGLIIQDKKKFLAFYYNNLEKKKEQISLFNKRIITNEVKTWVTNY